MNLIIEHKISDTHNNDVIIYLTGANPQTNKCKDLSMTQLNDALKHISAMTFSYFTVANSQTFFCSYNASK
jgi:hypothetical protein